MSRRARVWAPVGAVVLGLAVGTAAFCLSDVTSRPSEYNGRPAGDVLVNGQTVLSIRTTAAGMTPVQRAEKIANRLQQLPEANFTGNQVQVRRVTGGRAVFAGDQALVTVTSQEARAHLTSPQVLAQVWQTDIVQAATGQVPAREPPPPPTETSTDWTGQSQKWVPILSVANEGARIGAAQVAGPTGKVEQVVGVAQLGLEFRNLARITVYVPVSNLNLTRLQRVQGVSVWAIGDLRIIRF